MTKGMNVKYFWKIRLAKKIILGWVGLDCSRSINFSILKLDAK
jgi:hypothetical protein